MKLCKNVFGSTCLSDVLLTEALGQGLDQSGSSNLLPAPAQFHGPENNHRNGSSAKQRSFIYSFEEEIKLKFLYDHLPPNFADTYFLILSFHLSEVFLLSAFKASSHSSHSLVQVTLGMGGGWGGGNHFQVIFLFKALFIILRWYLSLSQFLTSVQGTFSEAALYVISRKTVCGNK